MVESPTLFAEPITHVGTFPITNSLVTTWLAVALLVIISLVIRTKIKIVPHGIQNYLELGIEHALTLADSITGSREKSLRFMPLVLGLFIFILCTNWLGILPGVGSIGFTSYEHGEALFIPLFRGPTADLNTTFALGLLAVIATHIGGVMTQTLRKHTYKFLPFHLLTELPRKILKEKNYSAIIVNPITFCVGILEGVGELAKILSLSFRLFGNVFAGEVLLASMAAIMAFVLPIPFLVLEIMVGAIQAFIFSILTLVFMTMMATSHEHDEVMTENAAH